MKLVQEAKERLEVEKRQASKARNPVPITKTPTGSARPFHKGSVHPVQDDHGNAFLDSPLFASDDNQNNPPQAERKYDHDGQSDNSSTNEMNFRMQQHENTKRAFVQRRDVHSPPMQIKRHKPSESLGKISSVPSPVHPTYTRNASSSTGQELSAKLLSKILLGNDIVKQVEDGVFAMRLDESAHCSIVYLTTERGSKFPALPSLWLYYSLKPRRSTVLHHDLSHVGNVLSAFHEAALPEDDHVDASAWQAAKCFSAAVSLAKKAYEHGYNALIKVKAFSGVPSSKDSTVFEFFTSGIPAVVIVPDEVPKLVPVQAKTPNPTSSRREITEKQSAEANPGQQHRPPRTSYLDDVRQPLRTFYNSS